MTQIKFRHRARLPSCTPPKLSSPKPEGRNAARKRLALGRVLVEAKAACRHGEWLPFLEKQGIDERTARRYMGLVEFSDSKSDTVSDLPASLLLPSPTYADAGIDKAAAPFRNRRTASASLQYPRRGCRLAAGILPSWWGRRRLPFFNPERAHEAQNE